jgi:hypothetical protein
MSPFTCGVLVYSDGNWNRALKVDWLLGLGGGGVCVCVHTDGWPVHCRLVSV